MPWIYGIHRSRLEKHLQNEFWEQINIKVRLRTSSFSEMTWTLKNYHKLTGLKKIKKQYRSTAMEAAC